MYYEECVIDGVLHTRNRPDAEFVPMSAEALTDALIRARKWNLELQSIITDGREVVQ